MEVNFYKSVNSTNGSTVANSSKPVPFGSDLVAVLTPIYWTIAVVIVVLNGALLMLYIRHRSVRQSLNYFIVTQTFTDILMGSVTIPFALALPRQTLIGNTTVNDGACVIALVLPMSILNMMLWVTCLIAVDRLVAVLKPSQYRQLCRGRRCFVVALTLWIVVVLYNMLPLFGLGNFSGNERRTYCRGFYRYTIAYIQGAVCLHLVLPVLATVGCYVTMYVVIRKKQTESAPGVTGHTPQPGLVKAVAAAKTCLITTALVALGLLPLLIVLILVPLFENVSFMFRLYSYGITFLLAETTSAFHPVVYFLRSTAIRHALKKSFCWTRSRVDPLTTAGAASQPNDAASGGYSMTQSSHLTT